MHFAMGSPNDFPKLNRGPTRISPIFRATAAASIVGLFITRSTHSIASHSLITRLQSSVGSPRATLESPSITPFITSSIGWACESTAAPPSASPRRMILPVCNARPMTSGPTGGTNAIGGPSSDVATGLRAALAPKKSGPGAGKTGELIVARKAFFPSWPIHVVAQLRAFGPPTLERDSQQCANRCQGEQYPARPLHPAFPISPVNVVAHAPLWQKCAPASNIPPGARAPPRLGAATRARVTRLGARPRAHTRARVRRGHARARAHPRAGAGVRGWARTTALGWARPPPPDRRSPPWCHLR